VQRQRIFTRTLLVIPQHVLVIPHHHALSFRSAAEESAFAFLGCHSASPCFVIPQRSEGICICLSSAPPTNRHFDRSRTRFIVLRSGETPVFQGARQTNENTGVSPLQPQTTRPPVEMTSSVSALHSAALACHSAALACHSAAPRLSFRSTMLVIPQHHACHSAAQRRQSESRPCLSFRSTAKESAFAFVTCIPEGNLSLALACHSAAQRRNLHSPLSFVIPKGNLRLAFPSFSPEIPQRLSRSHHRSLGQP
jgi:hypothetical protein